MLGRTVKLGKAIESYGGGVVFKKKSELGGF